MLARHWERGLDIFADCLLEPEFPEADLEKERRQVLDDLDRVVFAGPPNFEDVRKGDAPEPTYVLRLDHRICITGDDFADPATMFDAVHLVAEHDNWAPLRANLHRRVTVTLVRPMGAETGHHHEPLVAWVTRTWRSWSATSSASRFKSTPFT